MTRRIRGSQMLRRPAAWTGLVLGLGTLVGANATLLASSITVKPGAVETKPAPGTAGEPTLKTPIRTPVKPDETPTKTPTRIDPAVIQKFGPPVDVQLRISQMQCINLTREEGLNNDRDEVYILVRGNTREGLVGERFPLHFNGEKGDSYYEFNANKSNTQNDDWTNHDQVPVGRPVLWSGTIPGGSSVEFLVTVMEQDNGDLSTIKKAVQEGLKLAGELYNQPQYNAVLGSAKELANQLPDIKGHELVGSFVVQIANKGGVPVTTWMPVVGKMNDPKNPAVQGVMTREKAQAAMFDLQVQGGTGQYLVIPSVAVGPTVSKRYYVSREIDRCGENLLSVEGSDGFYHVSKGKSSWVPLKEPRFRWYCDNNEEWATAPAGTNLVNVIRSGSDDRKITWVCYQEKGERPDYQPTQTWVRLSDEKDQCGEANLFVEGRGGFYQLSKGKGKVVPINNRRFSWYCDTTQEWATAPEGTNLLIAARNAQTREVTWTCAREKISLAPFTKPDDTKVLIGRTSDQCSEESLNVLGSGGFYLIKKGENRFVPIDNPRFNWACETSMEAATAPTGANLVQGVRSATNRQIDWNCYREVGDLSEFKKPTGHDLFLGKTEDKCGENILKVENAKGERVVVKKGESEEVMLKENRFRWWCDNTEEFATLPERTNKVKVTRAKEGRDITWRGYMHR